MSAASLFILLIFYSVWMIDGQDNTTVDDVTTQDTFTDGPSAAELRLQEIARELDARRSQSFNITLYTVSSGYEDVPITILEEVFFDSDYLKNVSARPTFETIDEIVKTLSIVIDVLDDSSVQLTTHELLCTTQLLDDITTSIFLEMTASDFDDFGEFSTIMSYIIEICDLLLDARQHENWNDIRRVYPGVSMVISVVDTVSLAIANILSVPGSLYSNVKNIEYFLQLNKWINLTVTDWMLQVNHNEGISIPKHVMEKTDFEDDDDIALVAVFYKNVSHLMGRNVTKQSVTAEIVENSIYRPSLLSLDVISTMAVKVPDLSGTSIPITYRLHHDTAKKTNDTEVLCVWWDFSQAEENGGLWSNEGCSWIAKTARDDNSQCYCNHTTNFGLLLQRHEVEPIDYQMIHLSWIIPIAAGVTIVPVIPFIFVLIYLGTMHKTRRVAQIIFLVTFVIANVLIAASPCGKYHLYACMGINFATHYFLVTSSTWLMLISIILFTRLVQCIKREIKIWQCLIVGFVLPVLPVGGMGGYKYADYGTWNWCWINYDSYMLYAYVGPLGLTSVVSMLCLLASLRAVIAASKMSLFVREKDEMVKIRGTCFCFLVVQPVFLLFYGLMYYWYSSSFKMYLGYVFGVFFAVHGPLIVILEAVANKELRVAWKLKKNPPKVIKDDHDIWADDVVDDANDYEEHIPQKLPREDTKMSVEDLDEHDADSVYSSRPGTRNSVITIQALDFKYVPPKTNYFARLKQMQEGGAENGDDNTNLQLPERDYRQADGESRGRNSAASQGRRSAEIFASKKPKLGLTSGLDDGRTSTGSYHSTKKKSVKTLAENLPKSPAPATPLMRPPSLPGSPDDPEEYELEVTTPTGRRTGDGASPLYTDRKSPEGYNDDDGYGNDGYEDGEDYGDYDDYEEGEYDDEYDYEEGEYYEGEDYTEGYD